MPFWSLRRDHGWGIVLASLTFLVAAALLRDSAGVAVRRLSDTQDSLVARADEALYTAKSEGRDRACLSPDDQGRGREYEPVG